MTTNKYIPIDESMVPDGVRFDVPRRNQGQMVEVAFGGFGAAEHAPGDPYKRVTDASDRSVSYYRLAVEASLSRALQWARTADLYDYLVKYEDTGMTDSEDPGSRCGYSDADLAEIRRVLVKRDLTLVADDRGLVAQAARS